MAIEIEDRVKQFIEAHRVAHLATSDAAGNPSVIPICYIFDGAAFYSAIDDKPKRLVPNQLQRIRNIRANPRVALLIDDYSEDWSELAYVLIRGIAGIIEPDGSSATEHARAIATLRVKYAQYRSMTIEQHPMIRIVPDRVHFWSAVPS